MGGMISLEMAARAPQRLLSLMLVNTHAGQWLSLTLSSLYLRMSRCVAASVLATTHGLPAVSFEMGTSSSPANNKTAVPLFMVRARFDASW